MAAMFSLVLEPAQRRGRAEPAIHAVKKRFRLVGRWHSRRCGRLAAFRMATQPEVLESNRATPSDAATPATAKPSVKDWFRCITIVLIASNVLVFLIMVLQGVALFSPT